MDKCFETLCAAIDRLLEQRPRVLLAIEGRCTAGKTTLAARLAGKYGCAVFHMDDFFLRPEQQTEARYAQPGGNVDHERFLAEVLTPLRRGESFAYRPYDCRKAALAEPVRAEAARLSVVEGSYSMHPSLAGSYDLSVFLSVSPELQRQRVLQRPAFLHESFFERWIPMEERYFAATHAQERCELFFDCTLPPVSELS